MANTFKFGNGNWAVGKETVLAYNSENNNFKPLPFSFDRASTATVVNKNGLIETVGADEPRIDFLNNPKGHLLLEPQRQNSYNYSEPTSNEGTSSGITYESFDWSLGFTNCVRFGDNSVIRFRYGASVAASTQYTISAFVIMDDLSEPEPSTSTTSGDFSFVVGNSLSGTINQNISYGNNIYKVSATITSGTNTANSGIVKYTGQSSKGFRVVGWQVEAGSYATSYIPTSGLAVTRSAESCSQTVPDGIFGSTEGVMFLEVGKINNNYETGASKWFLEIRKDANNSFGISSGGADTAPTIRFVTQISGIYSTDAEPSGFSNSKIAIQYTLSNFKIYQNGSLVSTVNKNIGDYSEIEFFEGASDDLRMELKLFRLYNTALSDSELQALTTI